MTPGFWDGRRVLVTGHTGFKGAWLCHWLRHWGAVVSGYALAPHTRPSLYALLDLDSEVDSTIADIRDLDALRGVMQRTQPEVVIHMAAQALVRESYAQPVETYAVNTMGTVNLLEAVRVTPSVRAAVIVTTDKCYENREWVWGYREDEPMGGYDPYSSSKGCAELVTAAYRRSFFAPAAYARHRVAIASARAGNVIGGGDWSADRLVPDVVKAFSSGEEVVLRNPHSVRPWQHVLEPLSGYVLLAEKLFSEGPRYAEAWNFGPANDEAKPVEWVVAQLAREWGGSASWRLNAEPAPHEASYLKLDSSKARARLGWRARWSLDRAIARTVEWHRAHLGQRDMRNATTLQIKEFVG